MPFVPYKYGKIHYTEKGSGRAVVLLHGFLENTHMWDDTIEQLPKYRYISIDLLGHGESSCFGYVHTMEEMAKAVLAVLKHLRIQKAAFVGHSMGAYVALALAEEFPDMFKGLCLFYSTALADTQAKKIGRDQAIQLVKENHKSFIRKAVPMLFRPKNRTAFKEQVNSIKKEALATPKQGVIAALQGMKQRPDREIILKFAPYPVVFIAGTHDPVISINSVEQQVKDKENVYLIAINGAGHMGFIEEPKATQKALKQFLKLSYPS